VNRLDNGTDVDDANAFLSDDDDVGGGSDDDDADADGADLDDVDEVGCDDVDAFDCDNDDDEANLDDPGDVVAGKLALSFSCLFLYLFFWRFLIGRRSSFLFLYESFWLFFPVSSYELPL